MTGVCKLCRQIIQPAGPLPVNPDWSDAEREQHEYLYLAAAMGHHVHAYHGDLLRAVGPVIEPVVAAVVSQMMETASPREAELRAAAVDQACTVIRGCEIAERQAAPGGPVNGGELI